MCRIAFFVLFLFPLFPILCAAQPKAKIAFNEVKGTGLAEILTARRQLLEKRKGSALKGHEWWLWGLSAFDYDRDGDPDLLVCIHGSTNGLIIKNLRKETGKLRFVDVTKELGVDGIVPSTDTYPLMWDFDGDGDLDIAGLLDDKRTPCLINEDGKRFRKAPFSLHPINYPAGVRDLNGDGYLDVFQIRRGKKIVCHYDPKTKTFKKTESPLKLPFALPEAIKRELTEVKARKQNRFLKYRYINDQDLDGDGKNDLIISGFGSYSGERLGWYLAATKDGGFVDKTAMMSLPRKGTPFHFQDVDSDGDVDMLIASAEKAGLYLNDGRGRFTRMPGPLTDFIKQRCPYLHKVFTADFDNDGDLDLAISNRRFGKQKIFENLGGGNFEVVLTSRGWDADPLVLTDLNDDGRMDVIIGGSGTKENIAVFLNVTPSVGRFCKLSPRMKGPNPYAVGTRVEVFAPGALKVQDAHPFRVDVALPNGSPIRIGLDKAERIDLRVTFPGMRPKQYENVEVSPWLEITPENGIRKRSVSP